MQTEDKESALQPQGRDEIGEAIPAMPGRSEDVQPAMRVNKKWSKRPWIIAATALAVFLAGVAIGVAGSSSASELDAAEAQVTDLQDQLADRTAEAEQASDTSRDALGQVAGLEGQVSTLQGQVAGLKKQVESWKGKAQQQVQQRAQQGGYSVGATATFSDGTWRVGEEIQPGTYQASGGGDCYWERLSGFSGDFDDLIANDFGSNHATVTISSSDAGFTSEDCGTWHKVG